MQKLDDLLAESNGKKTIWQQFREIRVSISNMLKSIQNLFVRMVATEADIMDLRAEMAEIRKEKRNGS